MRKIIVHTEKYVYTVLCEKYDLTDDNKLRCVQGIYKTKYAWITDDLYNDDYINEFEILEINNICSWSVTRIEDIKV